MAIVFQFLPRFRRGFQKRPRGGNRNVEDGGGARAEVTVNGAELAGSPALIRARWGVSGSGGV